MTSRVESMNWLHRTCAVCHRLTPGSAAGESEGEAVAFASPTAAVCYVHSLASVTTNVIEPRTS